jgi:hypothetical protein
MVFFNNPFIIIVNPALLPFLHGRTSAEALGLIIKHHILCMAARVDLSIAIADERRFINSRDW